MKNRFIYFFILISFVTINQSFAQSESKAAPEISVPIRIMESSGQRPFINASVNGAPVLLMLHSSATLDLQISHKLADTAKVADRHHVGSYGIVKHGQLSSLGMDTAFVNELTVGGHVFNHIPVSIFEKPTPYDEGMLGLTWLNANRAIIDYQKKIVVLNAANGGKAIHDRLLQEKYIAIPMKPNNTDGGRYFVSVKVNDIVEPMEVSTVSHNIFDLDFAKRSSVEYKIKEDETYGGPTGTTGKVYVNTKPIAIQIAGISFELPNNVSIFDTYGYQAVSRPKNPSDMRAGTLGCDFLLAHGAVIDFGNGILYLKKTE
jgi:hypothetical protein